MPKAIAKLPRTDKGLPVPWVASWTSETTEHVEVDPLANHQLAIFTIGGVGQGEPILGEMNPVRQRQSAALRLCQVCGVEIARSGGYIVTWPGQEVDTGRARLPLILEPWCCGSCLTFALKVCPGIARIARRDDIRIVHPQTWELVAAVVDPIALDPAEREGVLKLAGGAVSYIKIAPYPGMALVWTVERFLRMRGAWAA